jgi:hypothetical protein
MGLFSRAPHVPLLTATAEDLIRIGYAAYGGASPYPPGAAGLPVGELDSYAMAAMDAAGYPSPGTTEWAAMEEQMLDELQAAAERGGDWAYVGALLVAFNCTSAERQQDPRYFAIVDRATTVLRDEGVAQTAIPPFALSRWEARHGYDGASPAGWPRALEDVAVPAGGEEPPVVDLAVGESRRLAQRDPGDDSNRIYAERRPDGTIVAVVDGVDLSDGVRKRWEWDGLTGTDYRSFLRLLGDRLVTATYWAHDDLRPYFPCRARSRDEMRQQAGAAAALHGGR